MEYSTFLVPIITLITSQIIVLDLARFRFTLKRLIAILVIELVIQVSISGSILYFLGYEAYVDWFVVAVDLPAFLTFLYISKRRDSRDIFTAMITIFISVAISFPSIWISQLFDGGYYWYNLTRIFIFAIAFTFLHFFFRKHYLRLQDELEKGWGIFSILPAIGLILMYYQYTQYSIGESNSNMLINCVLITLSMIIVFGVLNYVFMQLHEKYLVQEQQRILTMQNKAQLDHFEQQKEMTEKTNRRWHDLRHSTQELIELLETGKNEAALAYLKEQRGMSEVPKVNYCLHPAVNSILCLWAERSHHSGIEVEIQTDVPQTLKIDPMELSALFANALENAYDGCLRLPDNAPKSIHVNAHYNGKRLAIGIMNSCIDDISFKNDIPVSVKSGGGIGTRSIAYTVQRFHGTTYFSAKDNVFTARFILNI